MSSSNLIATTYFDMEVPLETTFTVFCWHLLSWFHTLFLCSELQQVPRENEFPDLAAMVTRVRGTYHRLIGSGCEDMHKWE